MKDILAGNFAASRWQLWPPQSIRVIDWNIDRGLRLPQITDFLASQQADVLIVQEVDLNARRTRCVNVAEELASKLGMNYVFGREFQELTQGSKTSPAYHGQATLSRWRLANPRIIRFRRQSGFWHPRWFLPNTEPFQERLGGRIAWVTEIDLSGRKLAAYNLHLESRGNNDLRISQLNEALEDVATHYAQVPTLLAGDLNLDVSRVFSSFASPGSGFRNALGARAQRTNRGVGVSGCRIHTTKERSPMIAIYFR
jgi:endonuclease/exonuclease/phosphatase family metal-dependent hydrolase